MKTTFCIFLLSLIICKASVVGTEENYLKLSEIFKLQKQIKLSSTILNEFKLSEGIIRIWAFSETDNKSYMLWLQEGNASNSKLVEFDGSSQKKLNANQVIVPEWLPRLFDRPLDLTESNNHLGATIEHSFIIESVKGGKYYWAYRKITGGNKSDYSKLLGVIGAASVDAIDIGWTIDE